MFGRLFKRRHWRLVKSLRLKHPTASYVYDIHLYESQDGKRKAEYFGDGNPYNINNKVFLKRSSLYQQQVYPWLQGRYDPEIPRYSQMPEEDLANALKGKVS